VANSGGVSEGLIDTAAEMAMLGLDPLKFLYTKDDMERDLFFVLRDKLIEQREKFDNNLAVAIATQINELFKPK
jgi:hypothetical protein